MTDIQGLIAEREELQERLAALQEVVGGADTPETAKKLQELNAEKARAASEYAKRQAAMEEAGNELAGLNKKVAALAGSGIDRILEAIKNRRWYFFKNKPKVLMDKNTGLLWANLQYFPYLKDINPNTEYSYNDSYREVREKLLQINDEGWGGYSDWMVPDPYELWNLVEDKSFPYCEGDNWRIKSTCYWVVNYNGNIQKKDLDDQGATSDITTYNGCFFPCVHSLVPSPDYIKNIAPENGIYTEKEKLQMTLDIFVNNGLEPIFDDPEIMDIYHKLYIDQPGIVARLNEVQAAIDASQEQVLLSSSFDYHQFLVDYDMASIDSSVLQYAEAVERYMALLLSKVACFEKEKTELLADLNAIGLKLAAPYQASPDLTDEENELLSKRQDFFRQHFVVGMDVVKRQLVAMKRQACELDRRIDAANDSTDSLAELAAIEEEGRLSFAVVAENGARIVKRALLRLEFFEKQHDFAVFAIEELEKWDDEYGLFKTARQQDFVRACREAGIEADLYESWYADWQRRRFLIEEKFAPVIAAALLGKLQGRTADGERSIVAALVDLLGSYKKTLDLFYQEERMGIYQKFAFEAGGDLQDKFETESRLFKLSLPFQTGLQELIFSISEEEDKYDLLEWAQELLQIQVDDILQYVQDKDLAQISSEVLNQFRQLRGANFAAYLADSQAYSKALQEREKEYNSLVFKLRKDLMKK